MNIKFRAWDKFNGQYWYSNKYSNLAGFFANCQHFIDGGNELIFQQYTGLKDKNGKEIFEGDIIKKVEGNQEYKGEVIFGKRTLGFGVHVNYQHHRYTNSEGKEIKLYRDKFYRLNGNDEIIGNIYEHSHLLGDLKNLKTIAK